MAKNMNQYCSNTTLTGTTLVNTSLGTSFNTTLAKAKYHILGEDVEVSGYADTGMTMTIATLNVLGKPFYDELKKNNVCFPNEIEDYLKIKFRETRIDSILE